MSYRSKSKTERKDHPGRFNITFAVKIIRMRYIGLFIVLGLLASCKTDPKPAPTKPMSQVKVPKFNSALAFEHVEKQLSFGTRVPGSPTHKATREWMVETMKSYGWSVEEEHFTATVYTGKELPGTNIIAKYNPSAATRILLAAHYDTRHIAEKEKEDPSRKEDPIMGADDGASGVGVLMSLAKTIGESPLEIGVDIVFFDLEDYGDPDPQTDADAATWAIGSAHWAKNVDRNYKPKHAILLDMVGAKNATFPQETYSRRLNPQLVNKVWKLAQDMGYGNYFVNEDRGGVNDDHMSVANYAGIPMIDIIHKLDNGFGEYHHTHKDDIDIIDKRTMKAVGQVMTAVIFNTQNGKF